MKDRDPCASRRQVADLLRWSVGDEQRSGKEYVDYKSPIDQASTVPPLSQRAKYFPHHALAIVLRWLLSGEEKRRQG